MDTNGDNNVIPFPAGRTRPATSTYGRPLAEVSKLEEKRLRELNRAADAHE